jgi:uncharacterized protein (TIGR02147 family)
MKTTSVYSNHSCFQFVKQSFQKAQESNPTMTIQGFAQQVGMGTSTLKMILTGRRKLTISNIHKMSRALKLSSDEVLYLENLALKERVQGPSEANYYKNRVQKIAQNAKLESVTLGKKEVLADPYTLMILVYMRDVLKLRNLELRESEKKQIIKSFSISETRLLKILETIQSLQPFEADKQDSNMEIHYVFDQVSHRMQQKNYLKIWMQEAMDRLEKEYLKSDAAFGSTTISITEKDVPQMKKEIKAVIEKYLSKKGAKETVVQLSLQLLPLHKS